MAVIETFNTLYENENFELLKTLHRTVHVFLFVSIYTSIIVGMYYKQTISAVLLENKLFLHFKTTSISNIFQLNNYSCITTVYIKGLQYSGIFLGVERSSISLCRRSEQAQ